MKWFSVVTFVLGLGIGYVIGDRPGASAPDRVSQPLSLSPAQPSAKTLSTDNAAPAAREGAAHKSTGGTEEAEEVGAEPDLPRALVKRRARSQSPAEIEATWEVNRFLKEVKEPEFFEVLRRSQPVKAPFEALDRINGRFRGEVVLPNERWEIELVARLAFEGTQLEGESQILLSRDGKVFSHQDGKGHLKEFRRAENVDGLVVRVSPESYLHLFYLPRRDSFVGHYYKMQSPGSYQSEGRVWLERG